MADTFIPSYLGNVILKRTWTAHAAGSDEWFLPNSRIVPYNLRGYAYPTAIMGSNYPSLRYKGKVRPGFTIFTYMRANEQASTPYDGVNARLLNGLVYNMDLAKGCTNAKATDMWSCQLTSHDGAGAPTRVWDWARCSNIVITAGASGGPIVMQTSFISRWGETEKPTSATLPDGEDTGVATTFTSWNVAKPAGELANVAEYDFRSDSGLGTASGGTWTCSDVRGFVLHIMRGQGPVDYADGTFYAKEIATGMLSGALSIDVNPVAATIPGDAGNCNIRLFTGATQKAVMIDLSVSLDSIDMPQEVGIQTATYNYTLYDAAGACPLGATGFAEFTPA